MEIGFRRKVWLLYVLSLVIGAGFSVVIYWENRDTAENTLKLIDEDMATLERLDNLKAGLAAEEKRLYQFYAASGSPFTPSVYRGEITEVESNLHRIRNTFNNDPKLDEIEESISLLKSAMPTIEKFPRRGDTSELLDFLGKSTSRTYADIDFLSGAKKDSIASGEAEMESRLARVNWIYSLLCVTIFLISVFTVFQLDGYLDNSLQRKKLAIYPEHSPNPILGLSADGKIVYVNRSARQTMDEIGMNRPDALLPIDWLEKLAELKAPGMNFAKWEYQVAGRVFSCNIHFSPDYEVFHAYLADITQRKCAEENLLRQAYHDSLTGLPNRRAFHEDLDRAVSAEKMAGLILFNLDRFRLVIESLGHHVGDQILQTAGMRFSACLPEGTIYRFEGDLFAVLVAGFGHEGAIADLAGRLAEEMKTPLVQGGREYFFTLSMGTAVFPTDGADSVSLLKNAESALHQVRRVGGNGIRSYSLELNSHVLERLELESLLRHAEAEFELHYQPQLDIPSGRIVGAEALIRWNHPERGEIPPSVFIPIAEETGLILSIGEWVLKTACMACRKWADSGLSIKVAVNVSARQFLGGGLPRLVREALRESGIAPQKLELEVTESVAMSDVDATVAMLRELKEIGVGLSIDDFGTGYSSLSYLKRFPIDKLKIDRSFMHGMIQDPALVQAIISLGKSLKLSVIAEGVESGEALALLSSFSCNEAQGYLISMPLGAMDFALFARSYFPQV